MANRPKWFNKFLHQTNHWYVYVICTLIILAIVITGFFLYDDAEWEVKDVVQVCTGFFIVLSLFFTFINFEFTANKTRTDIRSAKETLTYNIAAEWHKAPIKDYQKSVIAYEKKFIKDSPDKTIKGFQTFIELEDNLEYKEALKGILNYFETLSIAAYRGVIDREFMKEFHESIFHTYYVDYYTYIDERRRVKSNNDIWKKFTNLAEEWHPLLRAQVGKKEKVSTVIS
jgi:hypothetical protein